MSTISPLQTVANNPRDDLSDLCERYSVTQILNACESIIEVRGQSRRKRSDLLDVIAKANASVQEQIRKALELIPQSKRKQPMVQDRSRKVFKSSGQQTAQSDRCDPSILTSEFMQPPPREVVDRAIAGFIDRTGNEAMKLVACAACARETEKLSALRYTLSDIPSQGRLQPANPHPAHTLFRGMLLYQPAILRDDTTHLCSECDRKLRNDTTPELSLANNMWIGEIPHELAVLTLPERLLIAKYFPAAYIVKLFPKKKGARYWDKRGMHSGIKGNVSTYRLDHSQVASMISGNQMPRPAMILSSIIGVTFVGPKGSPKLTLPDFLLVRRDRILKALQWLQSNNPLWRDIVISQDRLDELPVNGIPAEILEGVRHSTDLEMLEQERDGYVPEHEADDETNNQTFEDHIQDPVSIPNHQQPSDYVVGVAPSGMIPVRDLSLDDVTISEVEIDPAVIPLAAYGVIDVAGDDVPDNDILAHALSNTASDMPHTESFHIRRGSAFVNEYPRTDVTTGQRTDGGPSDANHLLGSFPVLFPYGVGGFEVGRPHNVPYETHVRWALQYADKRFRTDLHFVFQVFGVIQKRRVCRSATIQMKTSKYRRTQNLLKAITPQDLLIASREETRRVPFSNPAVQALRSHITATRGRIPGTDESRTSIRGKIWGSIVMHNPPNLWITINPPDSQDPIAQVMTGEDIDLDKFNALLGPTANQRAINIASDPYASARYFHTIVRVVFEEMFGITVRRGHNIQRKAGIFGTVKSYIGTVEAQGRGSLHLHLILWLSGSPTSSEMQTALLDDSFRERLRKFISTNIRADIKGADSQAINAMRVLPEISYARPVDPRGPEFDRLNGEREHQLARAVQVHVCEVGRCRSVVGNYLVCKRRAPFPLSTSDWISEDGEWGPRRIAGCVNNFCPALMNVLRSNHDIKLIISSGDAKRITWYITRYATKKQMVSTNASAVLAKDVAYHRADEKKKTKDILESNKRLLQRCANTLSRLHEFSGPEVMSHLMGWGDRYESHHYVPIYWDSVIVALKQQFPELRGKSHVETTNAVTDRGVPESADCENSDTNVQVIIQDGQIQVRDQLKEYQYRGDALKDYNFLDFFLNTYEGPLLDVSGDHDSSSRARPRSVRVPYKAGAGKANTCRVIRSNGHETLPHFFGQWFPRSDDPAMRELYCASMLLLLHPWDSMSALKGTSESFTSSFEAFHQQASTELHHIMENIQFYHESSDNAKKHANHAALISGQEITDEYSYDVEPHPKIIDEQTTGDITDEDVERCRLGSESARERFFGERAMSAALNVGIFSETPVSTVYKGSVSRATIDDAHIIGEWTKILKAATRTENPPTPHDEDVVENSNPIPGATLLTNQVDPSVFPVVPESVDYESLINRKRLEILNADQMRAYLIIERQLLARLRNENPKQLLMLVLGPGGTGKSLLIEAITQTFAELGISTRLAKTASSGVAASLIGGDTLHSWAGIPVNPTNNGTDWTERGTKASHGKRARNIKGKMMWLHDEVSMTTKEHLCLVSQAIGKVLVGEPGSDATLPFGGMDVILFGDFHQFPPVKNRTGALYCSRPQTDKPRAIIGREIYMQFTTVVILKEQKRISDPVWNRILTHLRSGDCDQDDLQTVRQLVISNNSCDVPDFDSEKWGNMILVTSRHSVRSQWNTAALIKHCSTTGNRLYVSQAWDVMGQTGDPVTNAQRLIIVGMNEKRTGKLPERVQIAVGMKAMVLLNIATEAELANGTRGVIVDIVLDYREDVHDIAADGTIHLQYPPAVICFKPDIPSPVEFPGLSKGLIPIAPTEVTFRITTPDGKSHQIRRRQLAVTPAYAFTDYKSQGQTIETVIVDIAKPPCGELTPFHAYVALSRSRGRKTIRLLRDFEDKLFTTHPSEDLRIEDLRLERLDRSTGW
ncbi:ATP-dependent DNA helicase PIF1 [Hypsizygus marmoreus]|uniref:ATP-dependent DNA helicase n=1 Tax=Hypsizygus marmoreus TaxID=39966 RepID=A0A369J4B7_HYPMA|nr:ATP-dependent DNA helicase PIF1 [Hypsizygus marmoreus]